MKKFSFKLESVLKYREHQEKKAQMALSEARTACDEVREMVADLDRKKKEVLHRLETDVREGVTGSWYLTCRRFAGRLDEELDMARQELEKKKQLVEERTAHLKAQNVKKESLKILRTVCAENHKECLEALEQNALDEMVLLRKGRQM